MTLQEMSHTYRSQHAALRQRIRELTAAGVGEDTRGRIRIRRLEEMAKENRDLAALLEHYYERGLSLIHISEPTRRRTLSRMPSAA